MKRLLKLFGLPTKNAQGHELGCSCRRCIVARELARGKPFKPGTVGWFLQEAQRKRREREQ